MKVKLLNKPTLIYSDWAIGECYDKGCHTDPEKMISRINRVANVNKHSSTIEFTTYIIEINSYKLAIDKLSMKLTSKFIIQCRISDDQLIIKFNARVLQEIQLPDFIYSLIPEDHKFLIGEFNES